MNQCEWCDTSIPDSHRYKTAYGDHWFCCRAHMMVWESFLRLDELVGRVAKLEGKTASIPVMPETPDEGQAMFEAGVKRLWESLGPEPGPEEQEDEEPDVDTVRFWQVGRALLATLQVLNLALEQDGGSWWLTQGHVGQNETPAAPIRVDDLLWWMEQERMHEVEEAGR